MLRLVAAAPSSAKPRREMLAGVEHLVVPTVAMVEGVRQPLGSTGPEFISAEELGRALGGWNGRPVVFHAHPTVNGQPVSAATPERWENVVGQTFNAAMDGPRLLLEAWIDVARAASVEGGAEVLEKLEAGDEVLEVSVSYYARLDETPGVWNGIAYVGAERDYVPDHFAVAIDRGACSVADGCGAPRANGLKAACGTGACRCGGACKGDDAVKNESIIIRALKRAVGIRSSESHQTVEDALNAALLKANPGADWVWVRDVFPDESRVVYDLGGQIYQRTYTLDESGVATLGGDPVEVIPETQYKPVGASPPAEEKPNMANKARVDALIGNAKTKFDEKDREWLMAASDETLDKLEPEDEKPEGEEPTAPAPPTPEAPVSAAAKPPTFADLLSAASPEDQAAWRRMKAAESARKDALVTALKAHTANPFSDDELKAASVEQLEKWSKLAGIDQPAETSFEGRGGPRSASNATPAPALPRIFKAKDPAAA